MSRAMAIADLPPLADFGALDGREAFRATCRKLFASDAPMVRHPDGRLVVFRNHHLRALAVAPGAGNAPPDALAARRTAAGSTAGAFDAIRDEARAPPGTGAGIVRVVANQVFAMNAPLHDPARRILTNQLGPRGVAALQPLADEVIGELLAELVDAGPIDFQLRFADELTSRFWGRLIGTTDDEQQALVSLVRRMSGLFYADPSPGEVETFDTAAAGYGRIVAEAARRAWKTGGFPLVDAMAEELAGLDFPDDPARAGIVPKDVGDFLAGNLLDAYHTAALGAANAVYAVLRHPGVLERLRAEPGLLPAAVFEGLRLEPPVLHLNRFALEELVFEDVIIPERARIMMCWGAGNLDPAAFPEPERFSLERPMRGGTTFGSGAQICPGRLLVGMLVQRTLAALTERPLPFVFAEGDCAWYERSAMAQLKALPIEIRSGARV